MPVNPVPGLAVFKASDRDQKTIKDPEYGIGLFTRYLIEGLAGRADGKDVKFRSAARPDGDEAADWHGVRGARSLGRLAGQEDRSAAGVGGRGHPRIDPGDRLGGAFTTAPGLTKALDARPAHVGSADVAHGLLLREKRRAITPVITLKMFATRTGVTQRWLDRYERGHEHATLDLRARLNETIGAYEREVAQAFE